MNMIQMNNINKNKDIEMTNEKLIITMNNKHYLTIPLPKELSQTISADQQYYGSSTWAGHFVGSYADVLKDGGYTTIIPNKPVFRIAIHFQSGEEKSKLIEAVYLRLGDDALSKSDMYYQNPQDFEVIKNYSLRTLHRSWIDGNPNHHHIELSGLLLSSQKIEEIREKGLESLPKFEPVKDLNYYLYHLNHYHSVLYDVIRKEDIKPLTYFMNNVANNLDDTARHVFFTELLHYNKDNLPGIWHLAYVSAKNKDISFFRLGCDALQDQVDTNVEWDNYFCFGDYLSNLPFNSDSFIEQYYNFV